MGAMESKLRRAVFLDRDDTLIACRSLPAPAAPGRPGDMYDASLVALLPGVFEACEALSAAGLALVVVTNQGSVARGAARVEDVERVHRRVRELLPMIDSVYYCPFHPQGDGGIFTREHEWRKPDGGMLRAAAASLGLDLGASFLIGDAARDIDAGLAAGLMLERCYLLAPEGPWTMHAAAEDVVRRAREVAPNGR